MDLYDARIVVIDDVYDDVKKLLQLMDRNGIAYNYYTGTDHAKLPKKPIFGLRILFLDLVLGTDGQPIKNKISVLMSVLDKILPNDNGPYIILAWTTHDQPTDDLLVPFKDELMNNKKIPKPIDVINIDKNNCMSSITKIRDSIETKIKKDNPMRLLINWESNSNIAQNSVLNSLLYLSRPNDEISDFNTYSTELNNQLENILYKIAEAELGKNIDNKHIISSIQLLLTNIYQDHLEHNIITRKKSFKDLSNKLITYKKTKLDSEKIADMNTSFHIMNNVDKQILPGNVYDSLEIFNKIKCTNNSCYANKIRLSKQKIIESFYDKNRKDFNTHKSELKKKAIPVLVEITPECDYSQKKWKKARFIQGILWPYSIPELENKADKLMQKGNYIYNKILIRYKENIYYFTLNAHYTYVINFETIRQIKPLFKARKEFLVDIQHWYSNNISRPGKIKF